MSQLFNDERKLKDKWSKLAHAQADKIRINEKIKVRNQRDGIKEWVSNDVRLIMAEMGGEEMDLRKYILTLTPSSLWELSKHAQTCHTLNLSGSMQVSSVSSIA